MLELKDVKKSIEKYGEFINYHGVGLGEEMRADLMRDFTRHVAENGKGHMQKMAQLILAVK